MLDIINRYLHGYVAIPVILACREKGFFQLLRQKPMSLAELVQQLGANEGHLKVALRMFESLKWLRLTPRETYEITIDFTLEYSIQAIPLEILALYKTPCTYWFKKFRYQWKMKKWLKYFSYTDFTGMINDFLEGAFIVPLLIALKKSYFLTANSNKPAQLLVSKLPAHLRQPLLTFFIQKGWAEPKKEWLLTAAGQFMLDRAFNMATAASYAPMLAKISELLFGQPSKVFKHNAAGHELHIDRTLNVLASSFQHERYFEDVLAIVLTIFNKLPFSEQPNYVIDMGCGDGSLLKKIYEMVITRSARGKVIEQYPLYMVGVDYNQKSLDATQINLQHVPHYILQGNINDPMQLMENLKTLGIPNPENSLHVRSFLDHDRPFISPEDNHALQARLPIPYQGVYVDKEGLAIPPAVMIQSLVEHLTRWASVLTNHGLLILEVHNLAPNLVSIYFTQSENFHFDAYHAFSLQNLVEASDFLLSAAEAGLSPRLDFAKRYPQTLPYTRITLNYFEKKPYILRQAREADLPALVELESACWAEPLRLSKEELQCRLKHFPEGQFVLVVAKQVVGVLYTQRVTNIETLKQTPFKHITSLHDAQGPLLQLLSINVAPAMQNRGFGDILLRFVLQWCTLKNDIEKVVGITRCSNYNPTMKLSISDYVCKYVNRQENVADATLHFHTSHGARILDVLPGYRPEDSVNQGAGILIEYAIHEQQSTNFLDPKNDEYHKQNIVNEKVTSQVYACINQLLPKKYASEFSPTCPLLEMGFDSLQLLELRELLSQHFKITIDPTFFFQYPTPAAIATYFQKQFDITDESAKQAEMNTRNPDVFPQPPTTASPSPEPIAIIGMACRFPGEINSPDDYWCVLEEGKSVITEVPASRKSYNIDNTPTLRYGGYLKEVGKFDAGFFAISPREAELMDPQHRILLEVAWEAFEHAGTNAERLRGTSTGVFVGIFSHDYETLLNKHQAAENFDAYFSTGNSAAMAAGRLSYVLGLQGPAMAINTACSSSLVAVHLACQSLRAGESTLALAGGVNFILSPELSMAFAKAGMLSPDGQCKTFDASANGYVRSEGCGLVVLKKLSQALQDGDTVLAVIRGTAVNQDGASNGLTAPNKAAQEALIRTTLTSANIMPQTVSYIETHGTGTPLGDPIEVKALAEIYGGLKREQPLSLGSVKTNIGHTEAAAGIAGLIKVVLMMQHQKIPPHLHLSQLNPHIDLTELCAQIPMTLVPWPSSTEHPRRAGISSFGFSGTNAHLLIEERPAYALNIQPIRPYYLLTLSAKHPNALKQRIADLYRYLAVHSELPLAAIAYTLNVGRSHFDKRCVLVVSSMQELQSTLEQVQQGKHPSNYLPATEERKEPEPAFKRMVTYLQQEIQNWLGNNVAEYRENLLALGDLYNKGYDIDWELLHQNDSHQRIALPTYPFANEYYWLPENKSKNSHPLPSCLTNVAAAMDQSISGQFENQQSSFTALNRWSHELLLFIFQKMGTFQSTEQYYSLEELQENLQIIPTYKRLLQALTEILIRSDHLQIKNATMAVKETGLAIELETLAQGKEKLNQEHPELRSHVELVWQCVMAYPSVLTGKRSHMEVMFPNGSLSLVEGIYQGSAIADYYNQQVACAVEVYVKERIRQNPQTVITLLEIGAGTGSTSTNIFKVLAAIKAPVHYIYTDISTHFIKYGETRWKTQYPWLSFQRLDIETSPTVQGFSLQSVDVILASNVLHATKHLATTLSHVKQLLKTNGLLILNELNQHHDFATLTFGLTDGWWRFEDAELRVPLSPILTYQQWQQVLTKTGFYCASLSANSLTRDALTGQQLLIAESVDFSAQEHIAQQKIHYITDKIGLALIKTLKLTKDKIETAKPFLDYGIDSLVSIELVDCINNTLGVTLKATDLFEYTNIISLAQFIDQNHDGKNSISDSSQQTITRLSLGQEQLYASYLLDEQATNYNVSTIFELQGELAINLLERALNFIVMRQDAMRMGFILDEGQPKTIVQPVINIELAIKRLNLHKPDALQRQQILDAEIKILQTQPFNLASPPPFRFKLLQFSDKDHVLVYVTHHIITDSWSLRLFSKELMQHYNALIADSQYQPLFLTKNYSDFIQWQQTAFTPAREQTVLAFWQEQLADAPESLQLPTTTTVQPAASRREKQYITLPKTLTQQVKALAKTQGVSLFICLLSAYQILLARYTNQTDIIIGVPFSGREEAVFTDTIGYFINILPLRAKLPVSLNFVELVKQNQALLRRVQQHQPLPLAKLISVLKLSRSRNSHPLFQTLFNFLNIPSYELKLTGLRSNYAVSMAGADYLLNIDAYEKEDQLHLMLNYDATLFDQTIIQQLLRHYSNLLENIVSNVQQSIWTLELMDSNEKHKLLVEWNQTTADYPHDKTLHQLFEEQVERTPENIAVIFEDKQLTYHELNARANQLAHYLRELGVKPDSLVAISIERSLELIISILAVLKAGGAYVPLDPSYPIERRKFMLEDSQPSIILTHAPSTLEFLVKNHAAHIVDLDTNWKTIATKPSTNPCASATLQNLIYVIYTSGSTGKPKGVMVEHQNVIKLFFAVQEQCKFNSSDSWAFFHSYAFDLSVWEVWGALLYGGRLIVVPHLTSKSPEALCTLLHKENITILNQTPSAFKELITYESSLPNILNLKLRYVIFGGEALEPQILVPWFKRHTYKNPCLINMYGITETTINSTYHLVDQNFMKRNNRSVIGHPIQGTQIYIHPRLIKGTNI